jgi:RNA polymerase-binding transcription factor DksA
MAEDASETFDKEQRLSLERNLREILSQVEWALQKLEKGSYGLCDSCAQPIDAQRLEALPYATLCLECRGRKTTR